MQLISTSPGFLLASLLILCSSSVHAAKCQQTTDIERERCTIADTGLRMNDLQAVGSHNSYKLAIPAPELARIRAYNERSAITLDYSHLPLKEQLNLGMRQIELDVVYDPQGGRFAEPLLPREAAGEPGAQAYDAAQMQKPGFKVLHSQDIDVRSNCMTWILCLTEIRSWSRANPEHVPILIMLNAKEGGSAYPGVEPALDFNEAAYSALDAETLSVFSWHEIITPDLVRGDHPTLREAVLANNWPNLDDARGKVFFALDERPEKVRTYARDRASLQGLPMFVNSIDGSADHAAYFTINDPEEAFERIQAAVAQGFIVRTRADANTLEARQDSTDRREAAFASGAQYISTDYYVPRLEFSSYQVQLPSDNAARCNPVRCAP